MDFNLLSALSNRLFRNFDAGCAHGVGYAIMLLFGGIGDVLSPLWDFPWFRRFPLSLWRSLRPSISVLLGVSAVFEGCWLLRRTNFWSAQSLFGFWAAFWVKVVILTLLFLVFGFFDLFGYFWT